MDQELKRDSERGLMSLRLARWLLGILLFLLPVTLGIGLLGGHVKVLSGYRHSLPAAIGLNALIGLFWFYFALIRRLIGQPENFKKALIFAVKFSGGMFLVLSLISWQICQTKESPAMAAVFLHLSPLLILVIEPCFTFPTFIVFLNKLLLGHLEEPVIVLRRKKP